MTQDGGYGAGGDAAAARLGLLGPLAAEVSRGPAGDRPGAGAAPPFWTLRLWLPHAEGRRPASGLGVRDPRPVPEATGALLPLAPRAPTPSPIRLSLVLSSRAVGGARPRSRVISAPAPSGRVPPCEAEPASLGSVAARVMSLTAVLCPLSSGCLAFSRTGAFIQATDGC